MNSNIISTPVLLIGFNRPDIIEQTFSYIKKAKPSKLYVSIDGPRLGHKDDEELVDKVKAIVSDCTWECETHYRFSAYNIGAEVNVSSAVSWVLENEDAVIVVEDDIIMPLSCLIFMQEMLIRYKNEDKICTISGGNFTPMVLSNNEDYLFSKYGHTGCGWATWRRAWRDYDLYAEMDKNIISKSNLQTVFTSDIEVDFFHKLYKNLRKKGAGNVNWDYMRGYLHRLKQRKLSIVPRANLTSNIGIIGLHASGQTEGHYRKYDDSFSVVTHPKSVQCNIEYDEQHFREIIFYKTPNLFLRLLNKIQKIAGTTNSK